MVCLNQCLQGETHILAQRHVPREPTVFRAVGAILDKFGTRFVQLSCGSSAVVK